MALVTESPVSLLQADRWDITYFEGRPQSLSFMFVVTAYSGDQSVQTRSITVTGSALVDVVTNANDITAQILASGGTIYEVLMALMFSYAKAIGEIPNQATEEQPQQP